MSHWPRPDVLALLALIVACLPLVPPIRRFIVNLWRMALLRCGLPRRRYRKWFIKTYRKIYNVYLDRDEKLDLDETYVSMAVHTAADQVGERQVATDVMASRDTRRLIIVGDPGSGKSTLLKAYGIGTLRTRHGLESAELRAIVRSTDVPFFIPLRRFAKSVGGGGLDLRHYLITEILVNQAGFRRDTAEAFLARLLDRDRCLVLLDGLDEVPQDRYRAVLDAIYAFAGNNDPAMPTGRSRMMLTCRRQNFLAIQEEWLPAFTDRSYALSPFRDSEIFRYVHKRRSSFQPPQSPETFLNAVRAAGTLDRHRTPLVLAMSVGLFLSRNTTDVPTSVSLLYREIVTELLNRHNFRADPATKANRFELRDKQKFLREFALSAASRQGTFQDFTKAEIIEAAGQLAPQLDELEPQDARAFVDEIILHSGLLQSTSEDGAFTFAHRSIQEYLAAERLQYDFAVGSDFLLGRASDPEWRQVILFFTANTNSPHLGDFLRSLAERDLELAVHCLAGASAPQEVAEELIGALTERVRESEKIDTGLAAMLSATRSPRRSVRGIAVEQLLGILLDLAARSNLVGRLGGDVDGVIEVLHALAGANTAKVAALVPELMTAVADDPRIVGILWRSLTAPGIEHEPACPKIVERLLTLVMDPTSFAELQNQLPFDWDFLDDRLRRLAYPFDNGLPRDSNLVTLLAWAEHLGVTPHETNRFFEAKAAGTETFSTIEKALRRTISLRLFWPGRIITIVGPILAFVTVTLISIKDPHTFLEPYGWWTPPLLLAPGVVALAVWIGVAIWVGSHENLPTLIKLLDVATEDTELNAHFMYIDKDFHDSVYVVLFLGIPILYCFSLAPLAGQSVLGLSGASFVLNYFAWWLPSCRLCEFGVRIPIYRPNIYIDVYDDPDSRHWLRVNPSTANAGGSE